MPAGSLDRWPEDYERGRPGWPLGAITIAELPSTATVLDIGAGTGKLTRLLMPRFDHVIAVEPAEAMRRMLLRVCPEVDALTGTGHAVPLPDESVDGVFVAQAFHWFNDEQSIAEIARVLRPGGALVMLWNLPAGPWDPPIEEVENLLRERAPSNIEGFDPLDLGGPTQSSPEWRRPFEDSPFEHLREERLPHSQDLDRNGLVAYFASMGWLASLPDRKRLPLLDEVRSLLGSERYLRLWETHVHWTRLAAQP
jgi:SAM-dependent methyltransferase